MGSTLIISNTTPLINFAQMRRMDLLMAMFGTITIPPAVVTELSEKATLFPEAAKVSTLPKVSIQSPTDSLLVTGLSGRIHSGEAACLALAFENPGALLLLDDLAAREIASSHRMLFTGTLGCLVQAKKKGFISEVKPLLQSLRTEARFWLSSELEAAVLKEASE